MLPQSQQAYLSAGSEPSSTGPPPGFSKPHSRNEPKLGDKGWNVGKAPGDENEQLPIPVQKAGF